VESSVDFTKGCFVGQELVARIDSRGSTTPTFLVRIEVKAPPADVPAGLELSSDGPDVDRAIGVVTTAVPAPGDVATAVGLAYVKRGTEVPGSASAVLADGRRAAVDLLPQID
jgi:folate-binding Fe-S cluster repair protein YgfZ